MALIGLAGGAGHGKDTVCRMMQEWGGLKHVPVRREAFADRLKLSAARLFFPDIELEDAVEWANGLKLCGVVTSPHVTITGREFLQRYGTESHRGVFGTDFWVDAALRGYRPAEEILVVTDVRFPNEAEAVHRLGGEVWQVVRSGVTMPESGHVSERPLPAETIDFHVWNDEGLAELRSRVFRAMNGFYESLCEPVRCLHAQGVALSE